MTTTTRDAITLANQRFMEAFERGDAAAVARSYTSDGQVLPPQAAPISGGAGIEAFWRTVMGMGIARVTLETAEVIEQGERTACEIGRYSLSAADGNAIDHGKYIVVWQNQSGEWKLHRDIWNSSVAPSAQG